MIEVVITADQRVPDFDFEAVLPGRRARGRCVCDVGFLVSEETLARWKDARAAYEETQEEIRAIVDYEDEEAMPR